MMNLYRLNLNLLIALDILLLEQSVTLAAKKLFITQAAMSNNLQQLRELFKDDLLVREKNHMVLTSYAKELQPKLHQVLQEVRTLVESGQRFEPETSERVFKIGMPDYMAALLIPKLTCILNKYAPSIKVTVISMNHLSSMEAFEKGDYELGIGKIFELGSPIKKKLLYQDTGVCILNKNHPLVKKEKLSLKDYLSHPHVAVRADNPNFPPVIEQSLAKLGYKRDIQVSLPFIVPIFKIVEESKSLIGTVIRSITLLYNEKHCFIVKSLPFKIPNIEFYLAWHQKYDNDLGHQWLREKILEIGADFSI